MVFGSNTGNLTIPDTDDRWIDSVMSVSSFQDKVAQLLWLNTKVRTDLDVGARIYESAIDCQRAAENHGTTKVVNLYDGFREDGFYPFPGSMIRKAATATPAKSFLSEFQIDFWIDFDLKNSNHAYYGVDLIGQRAVLTGYESPNLFTESLLKHQFILPARNFVNLENVLDQNFYDRKTRRAINQKVRQILALKKSLSEEKKIRKPQETFTRNSFEQWKFYTYLQSFSLTGPNTFLPVKNLLDISVCSYVFEEDRMQLFIEQLNHYTQVAGYRESDNFEKDLARIEAYDIAIIPVTNWTEPVYKLLNSVKDKSRLIIVDFAPWQWARERLPGISTIHSWEHNEITESAIPQAIFGALAIQGQWPANDQESVSTTKSLGRLQFTEPLMAGMDKNVLEEIDVLVAEAIRDEAIPGCQVLVARQGKVVFHRNYGFQTYDSLRPIDDQSIYDLASLTKVISTTQLVMMLEERGYIELDSALSKYLPELDGSNKADITIREIMAHQAGLFPYLPFWAEIIKSPFRENLFGEFQPGMPQIGLELYLNRSLQDTVLNWAIQSELIEKEDPDIPYEYKYSDIGFYLLKTMAERIINQPINDFLSQNLYGPLGMTTCFEPLCYYSKDQIVPTEIDKAFRQELVHGFVHDRNAALFGGISGHAGLFGNAHDIAKLLQMHLQKGSYGGTRFYYPETVELFTQQQFVGNRRGLGWDKPSPEPNGPTSDLASEQTYGHTGFTGTGLWADPKEDMIFIFLSNRVYPSSDNLKLIEQNIRTRVQDLAYGAIITEQ